MKLRPATIARVLGILAAFGLPGIARADSEGELTFGSQWWDQTAHEAKFQEYRQVPSGGFIDSFRGRWEKDRSWVHIFGVNGLREDQHSGLDAGWDRWRLELGYTQIPHNLSFSARTPYYETSPGVYTLPDSLQASVQKTPARYAALMSDFLKNARDLNLGFRTDVTRSRLEGKLGKGVTAELNVVQRQRNGTKPYGASFGFSNAVELPEPIDQRMVDADGTLSWEGGLGQTQVQARASGGVSTFHNRVDRLVWDNPQRITDGSGAPQMGQLDLYPDNRVARANLELGVRMPHQMLWSTQVGLSRMTQNDAWLPFTVNSTIPQASMDSLPDRSTHARATRVDLSTRLTSHFADRLSGSIKAASNDYTNHTPTHVFIGMVPYDNAFTRGEIENDTASFKRKSVGGELEYHLPKLGSLTGDVDWRVRQRDFREVERDKELEFGLRARIQPQGSPVSFTARGQVAHRKPDEYSIEDYQANGKFTDQPNLRRFDIADRRIARMAAGIAYSVGERVDLGLDYDFQRFVFNNSEDNAAADTLMGLQNERRHGITATAVVHVGSQLDLNLTYGFEQDSTFQRSREGPTGAIRLDDSLTWTAHLENRDIFWSAGADWEAVPRKLTLSGSLEFFRDLGLYHFANFRKTAQDLPDTYSRRYDLVMEARYRFASNIDVGARYGYEQYDITDFAGKQVPLLFPVTGSATALFLGDGLQDYAAHRMSMFATVRF